MRSSRDSKSFKYYLDYKDENGKRRQISLGHDNKRKAQTQRRQKEWELKKGISNPGPMRLSGFLKDCQYRTQGQVKPSTLRESKKAMEDFIQCVGDLDIQQVRHQHGEDFLRRRLELGNTPATAAKKIRHIKRMFQLAMDRDQLYEHPWRRLKLPKSPKRKVRVFSEDQCSRLIWAARRYEQESRHCLPWELLIRTALCTAMRRGELLNTTWQDVDFANLTIDVSPKQDTEYTWEWHIKDVDRRTLPLTTKMVELLAEHQAEQCAGYPYVFVPAVRYDHIQAQRQAGLWQLEHGKCPVNNFTRRFRCVLDLAGIEHVPFHDFRRTCLTEWLHNGLGEYDVMNLAGHACFETTRTFYLAVRRDLVDHARTVSEITEASHSVARLLRTPSDEGANKTAPKAKALEAIELHNAPGRTRTCNLRIRSPDRPFVSLYVISINACSKKT